MARRWPATVGLGEGSFGRPRRRSDINETNENDGPDEAREEIAAMFVQLVHIKVKPGCVEDFLDVFRINYEGTIQEPGNYRFDVLQDPQDETSFVIYEAFESEEAVGEHRKTAHYKQTVAGLENLLEGPRDKDFFRMVMPNGRDRAA